MRDSKIILAKGIKLDRNYNNVLDYSEYDMLVLLTNETHFVATSITYSFIRQSSDSILTEFTYSDALQSNYIAFQNPSYSNKWFFAWIDEVIYRGDKNTEIRFTIDSWTTWFNDWTVKKCFVKRHHVNDDTIGLNTVPENLDVGEVVEETEIEDDTFKSTFGFYVCINTTYQIADNSSDDDPESSRGTSMGSIRIINNNVFGNEVAVFKIVNASSYENVLNFLLRTNLDGHIADVRDMYIIPLAFITESTLVTHTAKWENRTTTPATVHTFTWYTLPYSDTSKKITFEIDKVSSYTGVSIKNNKCFVYPYNYLLVTNNQGSNNIYKYENFSTAKCNFEGQFAISIGGSGRLVPKYYKGIEYNEDECIPLGKYPTCSWAADSFTNWLTQNSVNLATSIALESTSLVLPFAGAAIGGSLAASAANNMGLESGKTALTANMLKAQTIKAGIEAGNTTISASGTIAGLIGQFHQAKLLPSIQGGQATGDVIWSSDRNTYIFRGMRVKTEFIKIIDDYFSKYGYAINKLEVPNITGRTNWNYIEIGNNDEIGYGDVPSIHMDIINSACRRGVTIWHNHANLGNYSLTNTIVS